MYVLRVKKKQSIYMCMLIMYTQRRQRQEKAGRDRKRGRVNENFVRNKQQQNT